MPATDPSMQSLQHRHSGSSTGSVPLLYSSVRMQQPPATCVNGCTWRVAKHTVQQCSLSNSIGVPGVVEQEDGSKKKSQMDSNLQVKNKLCVKNVSITMLYNISYKMHVLT